VRAEKIVDPALLQVMTIPQWCKLNGFSRTTGRRIFERGEGPKVIQLSRNRVGVRAIDNLKWQEARVRQ